VRWLRGIGLVAACAALGGAAVAAVYAATAGALMALFLLLCGVGVAGAVHMLTRLRGAAGSLRRQLTIGVGLSATLVTLGLGAVALLMFISPHDALVMAVLLLFAGVLTVYSTRILARGTLRDIEAVRDGLMAVGEGQRDVRIETAAHDELAELAGSANRMIDQLSRGEADRDAAERARRDLVAAVSHDLRTPLTSLRLLAEAVEDELVDQETRQRYLEQMSLQLRSLSALIEDLFELSRLEAGQIQWSMERICVEELVEETVEAMRPHADAKRVRLEATVSGSPPEARANPEKLQRVLFNLIQNAVRHTPADGSVTVAAASGSAGVEVEVADTGDGFDEVDQARAFEPFYRGGNGSARTRDGAGLGLPICRAIVEAHGGRIWFENGGPGARVRFSLPPSTAQMP
jgi:signal transduction histidine kinase